MTKKHFNIVAQAIKTMQSKEDLINKLCKEFKFINPAFDEQRFKTACYEQICRYSES